MKHINNEEDIKLLNIIKDDLSQHSEKQRAFTRLYNKYQAMIKSYVSQIAGASDKFTREEVFSLTMAKAFTKINTYNSQYPFIVWVRKIAMNTLIDMCRKDSTINQNLSDFPENVKSDAADPCEKIVQKELEGTLQKFIQGLNCKHKEVVNLRLNYNFSCKQIAIKLQLPIGTVTTILYRSRILIKESGLCEI